MLYMIIGTIFGIGAAAYVGVTTGSILLALLAWSTIGTVAVFGTALGIYLREKPAPKRESAVVPAE